MAFGRPKMLYLRLFGVALMSLTLSACLESQKTVELEIDRETLQLSGSVGDGPVVNSNMRVLDRQGAELSSFMSDANAQYQVTVDVAVDQYPLKIDATGGTDLVTFRAPDFRLESTVVSGGEIGVVNLNPFSTLIVALAENLPGGLNASNVTIAESTVVSELNSGLDTFATSGVINTPVVDANIAEVVKSSETLGELIRRTAERMNDAGFPVTGDLLVATIAADLSDGVMDGRGGTSADPRVSAVATLLYAQVLMEAMANDLHVLGANAEAAMNGAIQRVANAPDRFVGDLSVTTDMIRKARIGLAAAYEVTDDPAIRNLHAAVSRVSVGSSPSVVRILLPTNYRLAMSTLLANIASADTATIETVNEVARGDGNIDAPPPANSAPVISGSPRGSVNAGESYSFTPTASDPDGDTLTFSVTNLPSWASFNTSTGRINGTPGDADVGDYPDIQLTVSDGTDSASMEFSIRVEAISLGSITLSWTPPTQNSDGSALTDLAGYRFYWGVTPGDYTNSVTVNNPGITSYVIENLTPGTYEFVATAINSEGTESPLSVPATGTVR